MTPAEFAAHSVGVPWVRWGSSWSGMDCYGLIVLYAREVWGIDLDAVPRTDIADGFSALRDDWPECEPAPGAAAFMAWHGGAPRHCGMLLAGDMLLHSEGDVSRGGSVRLTRLAAMRRLYDDIRFHAYAGSAARC